MGKKYHTDSKSNRKIKEIGKNLQIHDRSQSWLGTDTSIKMLSPNLASGLQNTPFTHSLE